MAKNILLWVVVLMVLMSVFGSMVQPPQKQGEVVYSQFINMVQGGQIESVVIDPETSVHRKITATTTGGETLTVQAGDDPHLEDDLLLNNVTYSVKAPTKESFGWRMFEIVFPILLFIGLFFLIMRQMQGGGGKGGAMSFGRSKAKLMTEEQNKVTFADMAGAEEAKEEVSEVVDFLRDPTKFQKLGGHIPRGILMVGSPGTGKTLLARAIAGEAKVPFFTISGSDFVEMFVGVGASRVRDMFEQAKKNSPCIIFIDEIDAVGRQRGAGLGGGHDEREQTLNQLLVEMDGFEGNEGVIVIAATNRPDVLDPALLRPGRFDRQVVVPLPDILGREAILKVHMKKVPLADDVIPSLIARGTPGFSGADLANLVNEAALFAARQNKTEINMEMFDKARDKIMMGAERKSMVMKDEEKRNTAYHEAGHAIVGLKVPEHDPVYKVTIIPRGRALGVTMFLPEEDRYSYSKTALESQIASLYGGRIAEEIIGGPESVTTGASNDIERATEIAKNMVTKWGLSDMGPLSYSEDEGEVFLGRQVTQHKNMSDTTAEKIDKEIRQIIDRNYDKAETILKENMNILHLMADALMKYETIDAKQIAEIMQGNEPTPPEGWDIDMPEDDNDDKPKGKSSGEGETTIGGPAEQV
ncbi:ATP-dependent zinc metalloprotease FtsH [Marinicella sp. S1101]|uniref:ATP-dependent zinc metalloprotease FtsH n=1 Tax=Marinicella marina TaxID=2996016 RepID=UPI0022609D6B|nr:ATP-dependent zinc metalloprotease FtsH [Marinicella marina]MCX7553966.1 ATP-dependent zinc metalloprotease FtsH [Marinicella marina]MDJ1140458.1 ATP-dependent zinc metalloprotease FtsH [Marinicella marina]